MNLHSWVDGRVFAPERRRHSRAATQRAGRFRARARPFLEPLEDRSVPSASPIPIPAFFNPGLGGPDLHFQKPGPADNTSSIFGGEPSSITDFKGFIGVVHVQGTGTDNSGRTLFWDSDLRFMDGLYRGSDGEIHEGTFAFV
jgi:hypothetical protein